MTPEEKRLSGLVDLLHGQCIERNEALNGEHLKRRVAECKAVSLEHEMTELLKYVGTLEDQIADMTVDPAEAIKEFQIPEYNGILKKAEGLWPQSPDLNPRTRREDAMLKVIAGLLDELGFAMRAHVQEKIDEVKNAQR